MKVILLKDVKGIGRKGEIREVNDGYARNALIPKKLVAMATGGIVKEVQHESAVKQQARAEHIAKMRAVAKSLQDMKLSFELRAGEKGELYGSVSEKDIIEALQKYGVAEGTVSLEHQIKTLGVHRVVLDLNDGITATIQIEVKKKS
jgi:large subunit ribosomal protein L9